MKEFINLNIGIKFNKIIYNYFKHYILINIFKFIYHNLIFLISFFLKNNFRKMYLYINENIYLLIIF